MKENHYLVSSKLTRCYGKMEPNSSKIGEGILGF